MQKKIHLQTQNALKISSFSIEQRQFFLLILRRNLNKLKIPLLLNKFGRDEDS